MRKWEERADRYVLKPLGRLDGFAYNLVHPPEYDEEGNRTGTYTPDPDLISFSYDVWGAFCSLTSNLALAIASYADDRSEEEIDNNVTGVVERS